MAKLSKTSKNRLLTCSLNIQMLVNSLDDEIQVIEGKRTKVRQAELVKAGLSKTMNSKHLTTEEEPLSKAIDMAPLPLDWDDTKRFYAFGEKVLKKAKELGIGIRWGGDWDGDGDYKDQTFNDLVHFEEL